MKPLAISLAVVAVAVSTRYDMTPPAPGGTVAYTLDRWTGEVHAVSPSGQRELAASTVSAVPAPRAAAAPDPAPAPADGGSNPAAQEALVSDRHI